MLNLIAITDLNGAIGKDGQLLADIPSDMEFFKEMTTHSVCIMGRKTFDSIIRRNGKPLPNRMNVVLTSTPAEYHAIFGDRVELVFTDDLFSLLDTALKDESNSVFVCGGTEVYKELLPFVDTAYINTIAHEFKDADAYFPIEYLEKNFEPVEAKVYKEDPSGYDLLFNKYTRKKENN